MGEYADDFIDGTVCQECGVFFDDILEGHEPPGYPRTCGKCSSFWRPAKKKKKKSKGSRRDTKQDAKGKP